MASPATPRDERLTPYSVRSMTSETSPASIDSGAEASANSVDATASAASTSANTTPPTAPKQRTRVSMGAMALAVLGLIISAALHLVMVPPHADEWRFEAGVFVVIGLGNAMVAAWICATRSRAALWIAALANLLVVAGWLWTRTVGFPFGPASGTTEAFGWPDSVATVGEVLVVFAALMPGVHKRVEPAATSATVAQPSSGSVRLRPLALASVGVLAAIGGGVWLTSPVVINHEHAGAAGHSHDHGAAPSNANLNATQRTELANQIDTARTAAMAYPTVADGLKADMTQAGPYSAGSGTHYFMLSRSGDKEFDPSRPVAWLYAGTSPDSPIVGVMYYLDIPAAPEGFVGPGDVWHKHGGACFIQNDAGKIEVPLPVDQEITKPMCDEVKGNFIERTGWMLHAWVVPGWENPTGVFGHDHTDLVCADGATTVDNLATGCSPKM